MEDSTAFLGMASKVRQMAQGEFEAGEIELFIETLRRLSGQQTFVGFFLQISYDHGKELELGFFTQQFIADITLSNGQIYFCQYQLSKVHDLEIIESKEKTTLIIRGQKKLDYNILKPASPETLTQYRAAIDKALKEQASASSLSL